MVDLRKIKLLKDEYNSITKMEDQLEWVKNHQKDVKLMLDNDMTFPVFVDENNEIMWESDYGLEDEELLLNDLVHYLGWHKGVTILLSCYGIYNWKRC